MTRKTLGLILVLLGIVLLAVSLTADQLGLGMKAGIGWKQWTGVGIGILLLLAGVWLRLLKSTPH